MTDRPQQDWWSAAELAEAGLPDMPGSKRKVNEMAAREGWKARPGKVRRRKAVGGGLEYHWTLLPVRARLALTQAQEVLPAPKLGRIDAWAQFEAATGTAQAKARDRQQVIAAVDQLTGAGLTRSQAVTAAAEQFRAAEKSVWNWLDRVEGIEQADWLAYLVDRRGLKVSGATATPSPEFCALVKSDFLRLSGPSFAACYDRAVEIAKADGLPVPPIHQVRRWYKANVSTPTEIFCRKGADALRRSFPHQTRDKTAMVPLQCIQGDYHKFDVFVRWPGEALPVRPQGVFFSDVYSGKMLAWRLDLTANSHTVQLALGDVIDRYGVPQGALLDNGREFAAKVITGGAATRFRFKVTDEDIPGLLPLLGVTVHWATPYSGQSKPIERAFRDFCDRIAKHPAFEGAYTGNRPDAKPENYGHRAIPLDEFREVLAREVEAHNARPARRSEVAFGRSFNDVFNEGYKTAPIRRATDEQRRLWLLRAEGLRADGKNGELKLHGSRYWAEWMYRFAGQKIAARFDADNLHAGLHVYDLGGAYLGHAPCLEKGDFLGVEDARTLARKRGQFIRATRDQARAEKEFTAAEIAARLRAAGKPVGETLPEAEVVRLVPAHPKAPKPARRRETTDQIEAAARLEAQITRLSERRAPSAEDDPRARFERALTLEAMLAEGQPMTAEQGSWLAEYQQSAAYRGFARLRRAFGQDE
ncbi:MAG: transposase domain-containing protein [Salipiger marinus]|uniref:transposase domain-containing protein n=1 Tax=Salipiger marinus TaxID=555512 RepID=UPI004058D69D